MIAMTGVNTLKAVGIMMRCLPKRTWLTSLPCLKWIEDGNKFVVVSARDSVHSDAKWRCEMLASWCSYRMRCLRSSRGPRKHLLYWSRAMNRYENASLGPFFLKNWMNSTTGVRTLKSGRSQTARLQKCLLLALQQAGVPSSLDEQRQGLCRPQKGRLWTWITDYRPVGAFAGPQIKTPHHHHQRARGNGGNDTEQHLSWHQQLCYTSRDKTHLLTFETEKFLGKDLSTNICLIHAMRSYKTNLRFVVQSSLYNASG